MNARQRRRHVRGVRLFPEIHPATRPFVTFAVARWDRARRRTRRYHATSRAGRHNAALRERLAAHPNVRVWKGQHRLATYAATTEGIYAEVQAMSARWQRHQPVTGRVTPEDKAARPGPPTFPAALDTSREGLVGGEVVLVGRFARTRCEPPMRNIPFPRAVIVGADAEHNLAIEPSTLAADIRAAATVSVDVPDRHAIDAEEIPQAARSDLYAPIDFLEAPPVSHKKE